MHDRTSRVAPPREKVNPEKSEKMENLPTIEEKPAQAPVAPLGALRGAEYPTAPDKGGRGAAESGKQTK